MKRTWTIIGVRDVRGSFAWYRSLLGGTATAPAHDHFGQVVDADGTVLLCLHAWGAHEHPSLASPDAAPPGNGLLLFFRVDDFDAVLARARALAGRLDEEPHVNPNTGTREFSLRDPDGYYVTVSALPAGRTHRDHDPLALEELRLLQAIIAKHDDLRSTVINWGVGLVTALCAVYLSDRSGLDPWRFAGVGATVAVLFFGLDVVYKVAQDRAIRRSGEIEAQIRDGAVYDGPVIGKRLARRNSWPDLLHAANNLRVWFPFVILVVLVFFTAFAASGRR